MFKRSLLAFAFFLFTFSLLFAQDPLAFFPHHLGDLWEYWLDAEPGGYVIMQNKISQDSLGSDGKYYLETTSSGSFVVDTTSYEVYDFLECYTNWTLIPAIAGLSGKIVQDNLTPL